MLNRSGIPSQYKKSMTHVIQARIAEEAGAVAVMALERVPADIRAQGGVARMSDPKMIKEIMATVTIPVMAKARIGHFVECQVQPQFSQIYLHILRWMYRSSKPLALITSTNLKSLHRRITPTMSKNTPSPSPSSAAAET